MYILGFLFMIVIFILVLGLSIVSSVLRVLFGFNRRSSSSKNAQTRSREEQDTSEQQPPKHKKLFDDDEGEYVDFEEVKEK
ncbi:DUF4834 family protein [uncultured Bacteroides sp.]|uniref:DUF4834 family protein n=1 Tax=uncultured Bacteroides sp. TaxID=162156 RepID=UPI002AA80B39|nr:DUF4834 family protein [uncultured Bacteroides sp.]